MSKKAVMFFALVFVCLTLFYAMPAKAIVLPVNPVAQQQTNWCTFATTQAVGNYYGQYVSQCADVLWVSNTKRAAGIWGSYGYNGNCCQFADTTPPEIITVPESSWQCNWGNEMAGTGGQAALMTTHGVGTSYSAAPKAVRYGNWILWTRTFP